MFEGSTIIATLPAADLERAKAWYRDMFGWEPAEADPMRNLRYSLADSEFILYPSQYAGTNQATAAGLQVTDLTAAVAALKEKGADFQEFEMDGTTWENSILTAPDGLRAAWVVDSEGNIIGLSEAPA